MMLQQQGGGEPDLRQCRFDDRTQLAHVTGLREEDRQPGRRAVGERHVSIGLEEVLHQEGEILLLVAAEIDAVDVARHFLQDAIPNAFGQSIPGDHVPQGLALEEGRAGGVHHAHKLCFMRLSCLARGVGIVEVVHGLADLLQVPVHGLPVGMVGLIGEDGQLRQAGNRLQAQVCHFGLGFVFFFPVEERSQISLPDGLFLDTDLLGVGDDHIPRAAARDGDIGVAVAGEGQLEGGGKGLIHARRQDGFILHLRQLAQAFDDGLAGGEDQRIFHEAVIGILLRHGELGRKDRADQDRLARAHGQRQDVAGVIQGQCLAHGFQPEFFYEAPVTFDGFDQRLQVVIGAAEGVVRDAKRFEQVFLFWKQGLIQVEDMPRVFPQPQIPVGLQRPDLRLAQAEIGDIRVRRPLQDLCDGRVFVVWIVLLPPFRNVHCQCFVKLHGVILLRCPVSLRLRSVRRPVVETLRVETIAATQQLVRGDTCTGCHCAASPSVASGSAGVASRRALAMTWYIETLRVSHVS